MSNVRRITLMLKTQNEIRQVKTKLSKTKRANHAIWISANFARRVSLTEARTVAKTRGLLGRPATRFSRLALSTSFRNEIIRPGDARPSHSQKTHAFLKLNDLNAWFCSSTIILPSQEKHRVFDKITKALNKNADKMCF